MQDAIYTAWIFKGWDGHLMSRKAFYAGWNRRRMNQWYEKRKEEIGLIAMMAYVGDCAATDERDRICSLLGVANDSDLIGPLDPNSSVEDVYTKLVTSSFISKYHSLDIICYAHLFNNPGTSPNVKKLPSWVPDWRAIVVGKVIPVMASQGSNASTGNFRPAWVDTSEAMYGASGDRKPSVSISTNLKALTCSGMVLDKIDGLGGSTHDDAGRAQTEDAKERLLLHQSTSDFNLYHRRDDSSVPELMSTISRCIALDRDDRYLADYISPDLFRADFETFSRAMTDSPYIVPIGFREWFPLNKSLLICGKTLDEHVALLPPTSVTSEEFRDSDGLKNFYGRFDDTMITMARRLAMTEKGRLAMAPSLARKGDFICVLYGCNILVILREQSEGRFEFIGECYLDGFMNGEALNSGLTETEFILENTAISFENCFGSLRLNS